MARPENVRCGHRAPRSGAPHAAPVHPTMAVPYGPSDGARTDPRAYDIHTSVESGRPRANCPADVWCTARSNGAWRQERVVRSVHGEAQQRPRVACPADGGDTASRGASNRGPPARSRARLVLDASLERGGGHGDPPRRRARTRAARRLARDRGSLQSTQCPGARSQEVVLGAGTLAATSDRRVPRSGRDQPSSPGSRERRRTFSGHRPAPGEPV